MSSVLSRKARLTLTLLGAVVALSLALFAGPSAAHAETTTYCGGNLPGQYYCYGAKRWLYQTYGWGDQGGVCVWIVEYTGKSCSSGAGNGVYSARFGSDVHQLPAIGNAIWSTNFVHGIALS
jgi:hypothetical protein